MERGCQTGSMGVPYDTPSEIDVLKRWEVEAPSGMASKERRGAESASGAGAS